MKKNHRVFLYTVLSVLLLVPLFALAQAEFVPLTNLPGIREAGNTDSLPNFLNSLYRLCIGAAAVIAILQIMRGGVYLMFNKGSVAHNEKAKSLIGNSVLGLLLVLSPAIVFGIINPDILDLRLNLAVLQHQQDEVVDEWLNTCNITVTNAQRGCAGRIRGLAQEQFTRCRNGNTADACIGDVQLTARIQLRECISGTTSGSAALTQTQNNCIDGQVLNWLNASGQDTSNQNQRPEDYERLTLVPVNRDGTDPCPARGMVQVRRTWCSTDNTGNYECCAVRRSSTAPSYLYVVYYETRSTSRSCYRTSQGYSATRETCNQQLQAALNPPPMPGFTVTNTRTLESCTQVTNRDYTLPANVSTLPACGTP